MRGSTPLGRELSPSRLTPITLAMRPAYYCSARHSKVHFHIAAARITYSQVMILSEELAICTSPYQRF